MEKFVGALDRSAAKINAVMRFTCVAVLFVMMILGTVDIVGRYLFNRPFPGTYEITGVLMAGLVLLGISYTQSARAHVTVELLTSRLPKKAQTITGMAADAIALAVTALIFKEGIKLVVDSKDSGVLIQTIHLPLWMPEILVPVGALTMVFVLVIQLLQHILNLRKGS